MHSVKLIQSVSQPVDYQMIDFIMISNEAEFEVEILDNSECHINEIHVHPSNSISIKATSTSQMELVSSNTSSWGCDEDYSFYTEPEFQWVNVIGKSIMFSPSYADIGFYNMTLHAYFADDPIAWSW